MSEQPTNPSAAATSAAAASAVAATDTPAAAASDAATDTSAAAAAASAAFPLPFPRERESRREQLSETVEVLRSRRLGDHLSRASRKELRVHRGVRVPSQNHHRGPRRRQGEGRHHGRACGCPGVAGVGRGVSGGVTESVDDAEERGEAVFVAAALRGDGGCEAKLISEAPHDWTVQSHFFLLIRHTAAGTSAKHWRCARHVGVHEDAVEAAGALRHRLGAREAVGEDGAVEFRNFQHERRDSAEERVVFSKRNARHGTRPPLLLRQGCCCWAAGADIGRGSGGGGALCGRSAGMGRRKQEVVLCWKCQRDEASAGILVRCLRSREANLAGGFQTGCRQICFLSGKMRSTTTHRGRNRDGPKDRTWVAPEPN